MTARLVRWKLVLAFAAIYLIWGSTYLAIRYAVETLPPLFMMGARHSIAGGILYFWARLRRARAPTRRQWGEAIMVGGLLFLIGHGTLAWAEQHVASGLAALLIATEPLWVVIPDWLRPNGVRPSPFAALGLVLGLAGMAVLVGPVGLVGETGVEPFAAWVVVAGAFSWALGTVYSRNAQQPGSVLMATASQLLCGGFLLLAAGLVTGEWDRFKAVSPSLRSVVSLGYLIVFGSLLAFSAYNWLIGVTALARVSTYAYVNPIVAVFLGWAVAGEPVSFCSVVATAVIVTAVAMIVTSRATQISAAS